MTFEIRRSNSYLQPYYWRIVARNGKVLASSETYRNKQDCLAAIAIVQRGGGKVQDLT